MGKNQSASNLTNIIKQDASGNITFVSGSTTLMSVSSSGAITTTGVISGSNALSASYAVNATSASYAATSSYASAFNVAGTLTATTLVVQTITSSVSTITGSTNFGSLAANTHTFTGSVLVSGSQTISNGDLTISGNRNIYLSNSNPAAGVIRFYNATSGSTKSAIGSYFNTADEGNLEFLTGGTTSSDRALWIGSSANNNILKVQGDSRIAINLATATSALHLQGTGATSATTALRVQNANASASLVVLDNGYVGINTGSAQYNLDVNGISNFEGNLRLGVGFQLLFNNNNVGIYRDSNTLRLGGFGGVEILSSNTTISAQTIRLKVFDTGNISLSNPIDAGYRLDVSGSGRFTGDLTITGSLIAPNITGSLLGTASYATTALSASFALTASYIDGGTF